MKKMLTKIILTCNLNPTLKSNTEKMYNLSDNTSMTIDHIIDDSSNSLLSITLEPIEKRTTQYIIMDVCNTEDLRRDDHGIIFEMSKDIQLYILVYIGKANIFIPTQNAIRFYQQDTDDVTVKKISF